MAEISQIEVGGSSYDIVDNTSGYITDAGVTSFNGQTGAITYTAPVSGVKGSAETDYRTGNVNLTAANINAAPKSHASTATTYGKGTNSNYGHVKLSDSTSSTLAAASDGTAATPKAVSDALQAAKDYADNKTDANTTYTLTKSGSTITLTGSDGSTTSVTDDSGAALSPEQIDRTEESTLYVMGTNGNTGVIQYNDDAYI